MNRLGAWLLMTLALAGCATIDRPIIAGVLAEPDRYLGRRIELYGVVVKTEDDGKRFYLQDVSKRPLLVHAPRGEQADLHGQYIVTGVLGRMGDELGIAAERLTRARVTGGCC